MLYILINHETMKRIRRFLRAQVRVEAKRDPARLLQLTEALASEARDGPVGLAW